MYTLAHWVPTAENRSALLAVQRLADEVCAGPERLRVNPLFLHGPAGTGKTHLASALATDVTRRSPSLVVTLISANDFRSPPYPLEAARNCDLLVVEDLQHLPVNAAEPFIQLFDACHACRQAMVFTATVGPGQLVLLPARLTSRLASGLVVRLEPLSPASRLAFLQDRVQRRQLAVGRDVLAWLAEHLTGSGRQLEGAVVRLETLVRLHPRLPDLAAVAEHFRDEVEATKPTVERIAERVSRYFQLTPRQLQSRRRSRNALLPRQVSMYLARQLTRLSLEQIGDYFGGRDHSTVLHACHKVRQALGRDAVLSGTVRQLHADLA